MKSNKVMVILALLLLLPSISAITYLKEEGLNTDGNNYPVSMEISGTTTKLLEMVRSGLANISVSWTDIGTDTNDTVVVATLLLSNASQQLLIASLQTDNQTQAAEILLRLLITDQRYNETGRVDSLNLTKLDAIDQRYNETGLFDQLVNSNSSIWARLNGLTNDNVTHSTDNSTQSVQIAAGVTDNQTQSAEILLRLLITDQRYNESSRVDSLNTTKVDIGSANLTLVACQNVTGAASNLCTLVDTDTITTTLPYTNITDTPTTWDWVNITNAVVTTELPWENISGKPDTTSYPAANITDPIWMLIFTSWPYANLSGAPSIPTIPSTYPYANITDTPAIPTTFSCDNITGATSNLCTLVDTDTYSSTYNASNITNAPWITSYTDTNDTVVVDTLLLSNASHQLLIASLQTDNQTQSAEILLRLLITDQRYNDTAAIDGKVSIGSANQTLSYCGNITGATSNLCTLVDTDTYSSTYNASNITNAPWLTSYTDTNDTVVVDTLLLSNASQQLLIANLQTDNQTQSAEILLRLLITDQRYNETGRVDSLNLTKLDAIDQRYNESSRVDSLNTTKVNIGSANQTLSYCGNITGATSNLCTLVDTDTFADKSGVQPWLSNTSTAISLNVSRLSLEFLNLTDQRYNETTLVGLVNASSKAYTDSMLITTIYNATSIVAITGTTQGAISNITKYDSVSYNVSESSSDIDFRVNFTGITDFNQIIVRYKSDSAESHTMDIALWDNASNSWESYRTVGASPDYNIMTMNVYDIADHIVGGVVQIRFYSVNVGSSTHKHQFDWVAISDGPATPSSSETDPYSIHKDGNVPLTGNWDAGAFNITASNIIALINASRVLLPPWLTISDNTTLTAGIAAGVTDNQTQSAEILLRLLITDQRYNDTVAISGKVSIGAANQTISSCLNITGATSNLCTLVDTDTFADKSGVQPWLSNTSTTISLNVSRLALEFLNLTDQRYNETVLFNQLVDSNISIWSRLNGLTNDSNTFGTGTLNYLAKFKDATNITNSSIVDDGSTISIGDGASFFELSTDGVSVLFNTSYTANFTKDVCYGADCLSAKLNIIDQRYNETAKILSVNGTVTGLLNDNSSNVKINSANQTLSYCGNITGATSNLCTLVDTDTYSSTYNASNITNAPWLLTAPYSSTYNASNITNAPWITSYTDTNDTVVVATLLLSNASQQLLIASLQTDNQTQAAEILLRLLITDQRYNESSRVDSLNTTKVNIGSANLTLVACQNVTGAASDLCTLVAGAGTVTQIDFTGPQITGGSVTATGTVSLNVTWLSLEFLNLTDQIYNETALFDKLVVSNSSMNDRMVLAEASIISIGLSNITLTGGIAGLVNSNTSIWARLNGLTNDNTTIWGKVNGLINDNTSIRLDITGLKADNVTHRTDNTTQSGLINARALPGACAVNTFGVATTTSGLTCIQPNYLNITGTVPYQSSAAGFVNTTILITAAVNINMTQKNITTVKCILFTNGAKIGECD